jgi:hypothetical protein
MTPPIASLEEDGSLSLESLTLSADAIPRGGRVGSVLIDLMLRYGGIVPPHILNLILVAQPASGTLAPAGPEHLRAYCILGASPCPPNPMSGSHDGSPGTQHRRFGRRRPWLLPVGRREIELSAPRAVRFGWRMALSRRGGNGLRLGLNVN